MDNKIPTDLDNELEEVNKLNDGFVDKDKEEKPEENDKVEAPKGEPEDKSEEKPKEPEQTIEKPEVKDEVKESYQRPERFIPIPKYKEEKDKWKQEMAERDKQIEELKKGAENIADTTKPNTQAGDDKLKAFAEKHNMNYDAAKELVEITRDGMGIPKEVLENINSINEATRQKKEEAYFDNEWNNFSDEVLKQYPKATQKDLKEAKSLMNDLAHTKEFANTSLDYVFFKNKDDFKNILTGSESKVGIEQGKTSTGKFLGVTGKDFKPDSNGNYDFSRLDSMDEETRNNVMSDLEPDVFMAYMNHLEFNHEVEVNRNGRRIQLK